MFPGKETDPKKNIVCKCEKVTEAEVVTALHRSLPIDSTQVYIYNILYILIYCTHTYCTCTSRALPPTKALGILL